MQPRIVNVSAHSERRVQAQAGAESRRGALRSYAESASPDPMKVVFDLLDCRPRSVRNRPIVYVRNGLKAAATGLAAGMGGKLTLRHSVREIEGGAWQS
jgi:hypothetical protein